jgi:hypothetical protein
MPVWFTTTDRTAVDWDADLVARVAQVDLFHIERPADNSYELVFLFARAGQIVLAQKIAWARQVESADPVPEPLVPTTTGGGGGSSAGADGSFRGAWDAGTDYRQGDTVTHDGSTWGATSDPAVGAEPGVAGAWTELAAAASGGAVDQNFTADHTAGVGTMWWRNITGAAVTFTTVYAHIGSAVTVGAATVIDINVDGVSAITPFSIPLGESESAVTTVSVAVPAGGKVTVDVDSVGTPGVGEQIMVQLA